MQGCVNDMSSSRALYDCIGMAGAIMFNDMLSTDQCARLVLQLAETAFPFRCAHGRYAVPFVFAVDTAYAVTMSRPSFVPLANLTSQIVTGRPARRAKSIVWENFQPRPV